MIASERKTSDERRTPDGASPARHSTVVRASSSRPADDHLAPPSHPPTRAVGGSGSGAPAARRAASRAPDGSRGAEGCRAGRAASLLAPSDNQSAGLGVGGDTMAAAECCRQPHQSRRRPGPPVHTRSSFHSDSKRLIIIQRAPPMEATSPQHDTKHEPRPSGQLASTRTTANSDNRLIGTTESRAGPRRGAQLLATILALLLASACLLSWASQAGQCAPLEQQADTLGLESEQQPRHLHQHLQLEGAQGAPERQPAQAHPSTGAASQDERLADLERRLEIALLERRLQQQLQAAASRLAQDDPAGRDHDDDETIVLVLADHLFPPAAQSIGRLFKRSGISDQRLAEIQMLRALKKQLDKAKVTASTSSGPDDAGQAAS